MVFTKRLREGIRRGRIRCSIRIWTSPHVKVGGRYRMDDGHIVVDSIAPITVTDITYDLARESGFESVDDLLQLAKHGSGDKVYLIRFHYVPAGAWDTPKPRRRRGRTVAVVILLAMFSQSCAELGYSDRVLHRVPSPRDSTLIAVCQEVPAFDGPGYDIRLERQDGTLVRRLYGIGDGDTCHEIAWSPDGRAIAVVSSHVARAIVVDVEWALANPGTRTTHWSWRSVSLAYGGGHKLAQHVRFIAPSEIEYEVCSHEIGAGRDWRRCTTPAETRRLQLPPAVHKGGT